MTYQCTECDKKNLDTLAATLHYAGTDHKMTPELPPYPEPERVWRCEDCELTTMDMLTVAEHELEGHHLRSGPVLTPWTCQTCGAWFSHDWNAEDHADETGHVVLSGPVPRP